MTARAVRARVPAFSFVAPSGRSHVKFSLLICPLVKTNQAEALPNLAVHVVKLTSVLVCRTLAKLPIM